MPKFSAILLTKVLVDRGLFTAVFPNLFLASALFSDKQISIAPYHA